MVIDTNIIIAFLNGEKEVIDTITNWKKEGRTLLISALQEFRQPKWLREKLKKKLKAFLNPQNNLWTWKN